MVDHAWEPGSVSNLEATPLTWWFAAAVQRRFTGTLVLQEAARVKHGVYFERGAARKARTEPPVVHLGEVLVEQGTLDPALREATLERAREARRLHGELLRHEGRVDAAALRRGLGEQLLRQIAWLLERPAPTRICYFEGDNYLERWGGTDSVPVNPLPVVVDCVSAVADSRACDAALERLGDAPFGLRPDAPIEEFQLSGSFRIVADVLRGSRVRARDLIHSGVAPELEIRRALHLFAVTGCLDLARASSTVADSRRPPSQVVPPVRAPGSLSSRPPASGVRSDASASKLPASTVPPPASSGRRSGIPQASAALVDLLEELRRLCELRETTYYGLLGVARDATGVDVRAAFTPLARRFHPDAFTRSVPEARELAPRLFADIMEAFRVLSDPFRRAEYDRALRDGTAPQIELDPLRRLYRGMARPHRAEALLTAGNIEAAEQEVSRALDVAPAEPELIALSALIQAQRPDANTRQLWALIDDAAGRAEGNPKVHYYRGLFLQRLGKHASALQEFRQVVDLDPHHIDAARQVRLYEKTRDQWMNEAPAPSSPSSSTSGTFPRASSDRLLAWLRGRKS
jgi:curved DNA-binding protein CbpA